MTDEATIRFRGLCLFAKSRDGQAIHVMLAKPDQSAANGSHPDDMKHRSTLRTRVNGRWKAVELQSDQTLMYGIKGSGPVTMPRESQMANISNMPGGRPLPETSIRAGAAAFGSHVILHGGSLSVEPCVGVWHVHNHAAEEYRLSYRVTWRGPVAANGVGGLHAGDEIEIWHATRRESPTLGDSSEDPAPGMSPEEAADAAAEHFRAYYQIVAGTNGPRMAMMRTEGCPLPAARGAITISSCPNAQATLI